MAGCGDARVVALVRIMTDITHFGAREFEACIGTPFTVAGGPVVLELRAVRVLGHRRTEASRDPFALVFRGPATPVLPQATYPFAHPLAGSMEIFIVPVGRAADGIDYEAIFT